jgi:hypothetical protein
MWRYILNAKLISKSLIVAIALLMSLSVTSSSFAKGPKKAPESSDGWFTVTSVEMDEKSDGSTATWTYHVEETGRGKDLSHWVLSLGDCYDVIDSSQPYELGEDPRTGVDGIKWNVGDDFESGDFSFTIEGDWTVGEVDYATKAGRSIGTGSIVGPKCGDGDDEEPEPEPEV